ncbi:MAG: hypothetical protein NC093_03475 [Alistipes sp.]|nr:hypothetical protein [Alistipes sp.]
MKIKKVNNTAFKSAKPTTPGFQRGNAPLVVSRGDAFGRVWDRVPY